MQKKIEQFKKMAEADPLNEMGHFSLGKAYVDAGLFAEAIPPLKRTLELNPTYSKAYQLLGAAQAKTGDRSGGLCERPPSDRCQTIQEVNEPGKKEAEARPLEQLNPDDKCG